MEKVGENVLRVILNPRLAQVWRKKCGETRRRGRCKREAPLESPRLISWPAPETAPHVFFELPLRKIQLPKEEGEYELPWLTAATGSYGYYSTQKSGSP